MKRSPLPPRKHPIRRSTKPIAKRGPAKLKRQRAFYASASWKRLRDEAIRRAGHLCERCGGAPVADDRGIAFQVQLCVNKSASSPLRLTRKGERLLESLEAK